MSLFPLSKNKESQDNIRDRTNRQLEQYKEILKMYKQCMEEYIQRLSLVEIHPGSGQTSPVQTAMQLSQIKNQSEEILMLLEEIREKDDSLLEEQNEEAFNQGKKVLDQIESLTATMIETNYRLEEMDKRLINNLTSTLSEMQQQMINQSSTKLAEIQESHLKLQKKVRGNRGFLWLLFVMQLIGLGALAFIILYLMDYIYF